MTPTFRLAALAALLYAAPFAARADWTGTVKIHVDPKPEHGEGDQEGTAAGQGTRMRFDVSQGPMGKMAVIYDFKTHQATMLMDARQAYMKMDTDQMRGGRSGALGHIHCETDDSKTCLKTAGYAQTGVETVNGVKCDRWEHDSTNPQGENIHDTLWIPQGVKGFALVRSVTKTPRMTMTTDITDFKQGSVPADRFEVPAGYSDMSSRMGGMMGPPHGPPPGH